MHEHDGLVWADLWADRSVHAFLHGHLTGTRDGDRLRYGVTIAERARGVRTWEAAGRVVEQPDGRVRITGIGSDDEAADDLDELGPFATVLFVCTGNFYRSRFAEVLFNARAVERMLDWRATSRGLRAWDTGARGRMSPVTIEALTARGIGLTPALLRAPALATPTDLEAATRVIALDEAEHRPLVAQWLGAFADRFEFWSVPDTADLDPATAIARIDAAVHDLIAELAGLDVAGSELVGLADGALEPGAAQVSELPVGGNST